MGGAKGALYICCNWNKEKGYYQAVLKIGWYGTEVFLLFMLTVGFSSLIDATDSVSQVSCMIGMDGWMDELYPKEGKELLKTHMNMF
ncbi:hypothetical protein QR685DRAFT_510536 [Neurospora intermedia]|uniref:Uncharacterized protein n=1 Tax=Neurospora intermedia TaxID=5142 RepID=A0ABR3DPT8_NEUIN